MSSFFVLSNVVGPALPLWGRGSNGRPTKFKFWEDLTSTGGGPEPKEGYTGANCCECPDDNGASWAAADVNDAARGAFIFVEVVGKVNMAEVVNRLHECKANQKRVFELATGTPVPEYSPEVTDPAPEHQPEVDTRPEWEKLGFPSKAEWKAWVNAGSPPR